MTFVVEHYVEERELQVIDLSLKAWSPVFAKMKQAVPAYVYNAFYPDGWEARQVADIKAVLHGDAEAIWTARDGEHIVGWAGIRVHREDQMGEVYVIAVDPARQREGIATALMETAFSHMREAGLKMAMVETGGDPGHEASRATYEKAGFERWPVARYFREL